MPTASRQLQKATALLLTSQEKRQEVTLKMKVTKSSLKKRSKSVKKAHEEIAAERAPLIQRRRSFSDDGWGKVWVR